METLLHAGGSHLPEVTDPQPPSVQSLPVEQLHPGGSGLPEQLGVSHGQKRR